jgi:hypothetical protein
LTHTAQFEQKPNSMTRERPILFSGPMVRALLDGRKTQTRRVITPQPDHMGEGNVTGFRCTGTDVKTGRGVWNTYSGERPVNGFYTRDRESVVDDVQCPYGQTGDRLWVRETFAELDSPCIDEDELNDDPRVRWIPTGLEGYAGVFVTYAADYSADELKRPGWPRRKPSIHMPRWASRITLEITAVRVERINRISDADARAEGIEDGSDTLHAVSLFIPLWNALNEKRGYGWSVNPWAWVLSFRIVSPMSERASNE